MANVMKLAALQSIFQKILLVLEYDGFVLRARMVKRKKDGIIIGEIGTSSLSDPREALDDLMRQAQHIKPFPRKAIVVTVEVLSAVLELPVHPSRPRPYHQMHDLVRWEIEPFVMEQMAIKPIGSILRGKSYLTSQQLQEVVCALERDREHMRPAGQPALRFGEYALKKKFITHHQLQECLSLQDHLQRVPSDLVCGWAFQANSVNTVKSQYLTCAVDRNIRDRWKKHLTEYRLKLEGLYSLASQIVEGQDPTLSVGENVPDISKEGSLGFQDVVSRAAAHALSQPCSRHTVCIPASEPAPPFYFRPASWIPMAVLGMGVLLGIIDVSLRIRGRALEKEKTAIRERLDPLEKANEKIFQEIAAHDQLQKALAEKKKLLKKNHARLVFFHQLIDERLPFSVYVLKAVSASAPREMVLEHIVEMEGSIELAGWTVSEEAVQKFVKKLAETLKPKNMYAGDLSVRVKLSRWGVPGYAFTLKMREGLDHGNIHQ
jgi:hypothetical protein